MLPSLPILVFGALFMLWSRVSLAPAKQTAPQDNKSEEKQADNKIIVEIVR